MNGDGLRAEAHAAGAAGTPELPVDWDFTLLVLTSVQFFACLPPAITVVSTPEVWNVELTTIWPVLILLSPFVAECGALYQAAVRLRGGRVSSRRRRLWACLLAVSAFACLPGYLVAVFVWFARGLAG